MKANQARVLSKLNRATAIKERRDTLFAMCQDEINKAVHQGLRNVEVLLSFYSNEEDIFKSVKRDLQALGYNVKSMATLAPQVPSIVFSIRW